VRTRVRIQVCNRALNELLNYKPCVKEAANQLRKGMYKMPANRSFTLVAVADPLVLDPR
jgi:hypothetical protein